MNKFECLIITGRLEIQLRPFNSLLEELSNIQKNTILGNFSEAAINFGRLCELSHEVELSTEAIENLKSISDFFSSIPTPPLFSGGRLDEILNLTIEDLDLTVRDFTCLKKAKLNTIRDILNVGSLIALEKKTNLGKRGIEHVCCKLEELGFVLSES